MFKKPFRWNLTHRRHLGSLLDGERAKTYQDFNDDLLRCGSRILAFAGDSDLVFVGRSPESIFDFLSGVLFDSSWFERLELLHFSMRFRDEGKIRQENPAAISAMRNYFEQINLHPVAIAVSKCPFAFIDLVLSGDTFGRLITFLFNWSNEIGCEWQSVSRRIRLVGISIRTKTSPNTWRWQQHAEWINLLQKGTVKNISVARDFWSYLGDYQPKVSQSYTPERWGNSDLTVPSYTAEQLKALRLAFDLFELGRTKEQRLKFAAQLTAETAMRHAWFRNLLLELR